MENQIIIKTPYRLQTLYGMTDAQKKTAILVAAGVSVGILGFVLVKSMRKKRGKR